MQWCWKLNYIEMSRLTIRIGNFCEEVNKKELQFSMKNVWLSALEELSNCLHVSTMPKFLLIFIILTR